MVDRRPAVKVTVQLSRNPPFPVEDPDRLDQSESDGLKIRISNIEIQNKQIQIRIFKWQNHSI